jgi:hypothetical protein
MTVPDDRIRYVPRYSTDGDGGQVYDLYGEEGQLFMDHFVPVFTTRTTVRCTVGCPDKENNTNITIGEKRIFDYAQM